MTVRHEFEELRLERERVARKRPIAERLLAWKRPAPAATAPDPYAWHSVADLIDQHSSTGDRS